LSTFGQQSAAFGADVVLPHSCSVCFFEISASFPIVRSRPGQDKGPSSRNSSDYQGFGLRPGAAMAAVGSVPSAAPAVYHVAQNKHSGDRRGGMMIRLGTLEATRRTRR
jgi:hypothetical protein